MNQNTISPDDDRLTAYAFNEMTATERAEFETLLQADPAARRIVEEIRSAGAMLATALEHEPMAAAAAPSSGYEKPTGKIIRFPHFYYIVSGLAAACFAVFFAYVEHNQQFAPAAKYVEVPLQPSVAAAPPPAPMPMDLPSAEGDESVTDGLALKDLARLDERKREIEASARNQAYGDMVAAGQLAKVSAPRMQSAPAMVWAKSRADVGFDTEAYGYRKDNDFLTVKENPLSTFAVDVDTASYANVRRFINEGRRPPADAVRVEELINYFPYHYQAPTSNVPF